MDNRFHRPSAALRGSQRPRRHGSSVPALLLAPLLTLFPLAAPAATWQSLLPTGKSAATTTVEIDMASLVRGSDGKVRVWHRERHPERQLHEAWAFSYRELAQWTEFDCSKRMALTLQRIWRGDDGIELKNERLTDGEAQAVVPDSRLERVFSRACRKPAPAAEQEKAAEAAKPAPPPSGPVDWGYDGKGGPAHWAKLSTDYATCGQGRMQSPVDLRAPIRADLPPIRFDWRTVPLTLIDTGHTIEVRVENGGHTLIDGEQFTLQAFRFRRPGEESVAGKRAVMSVQFEHRSESGKVAILAVPLVEGKENRLVRTLWSALPLTPGEAKTVTGTKIDPGMLIPRQRDYYTYAGSMTTPPCSEGVLWLVMKSPVSISKEQVADFAKVYQHNARPLQPANDRVIKASR